MLLPQETQVILPKLNVKTGGVKLNSVELTFLYHLYIHRSMASGVIRELLEELYEHKPRKNVISNRLGRLVETKMLIRDEELVGGICGGLKRYQYRLTRRSYQALADIGLVDREDMEKYLRVASRLKAFTVHNRSATMLASRIAHTYLSEKELHDVTFCRGSNHPRVNQGVFGGNVKGFSVPDYIFENKEVVVCIENDTGSQRGGIFQEKFERYQEVAKMISPRKLYIVFSVVDDSLFEELGEDRKKRVASIKQAFPSSLLWEDNLYSFAVSAKDAAILVKDLLLDKCPLNIFERMDKVDSWLSIVSKQLGETYSCDNLYYDDIFFASRNNSLDGDGIVRIKHWDGSEATISIVYSEQGSIRDLQVVREQLNQIEMLKESFIGMKNMHHFRVLILYETEEALKKDIRRLPVTSYIYVASIESWRRWSEGESYTWYKVNSPYRLKEMGGFEL